MNGVYIHTVRHFGANRRKRCPSNSQDLFAVAAAGERPSTPMRPKPGNFNAAGAVNPATRPSRLTSTP